MIRINLLAVRESRRVEAVKRELAIAGLVFVALCSLCIAAFIFVQTDVSTLRSQNEGIQQDINNLQATVAQVDEMDKIKKELQKKLDVIDQLKRNKTGPVHMLDEISEAAPEKLTLTILEESNRRLTIEGYAVSNEVVSKFVANLKSSDWFKEVYLIEIDAGERSGYKIKEFSLTARLVVPGEEEPEEEEEGKKGKKKAGKK